MKLIYTPRPIPYVIYYWFTIIILCFILPIISEVIILENFENYIDLFSNSINPKDSISADQIVSIDDFYTEEFEDLFVDPNMINYYTNENNEIESIPDTRITVIEEDIGLHNLNALIESPPLGNSRFSLDLEEENTETLDINAILKSNKFYYLISGTLITGTIITVITLLLTK